MSLPAQLVVIALLVTQTAVLSAGASLIAIVVKRVIEAALDTRNAPR